MIIKVTQEHIDKGRQNKNSVITSGLISQYCPIALVLKDIFKVNYVKADYKYIDIGQFPNDNIVFSIETPKEIESWMLEFDNDNDVNPFEFELSLEGVKL